MPKLEAASITQKISLSQIIDSGNIREYKKYGPNEKGEYPPEIIELAQSIKQIGQIQPVIVKPAGGENGNKQYELIAGFRRRAAFQYLCNQGDDFQQIEANIKTGDKLIIQLVENLQREDLTAPERERAIFQLAENGMKQNEIAAQLSKSKGFVSVNISAWKMRAAAENENIDLTGVETSTLSELLSVPDAELTKILRELVRLGGTRAAAAMLAAPHKKGKQAGPPEINPAVEPDNTPEGDPVGVDIDFSQPEPVKGPPAGTGPVTPPPEKPKKGNEKEPEKIEADHRLIDLNIILTVIYDFIKSQEKIYMESEEHSTVGDFAKEKMEAAKDILALIHKKIDE